jgi:hypothetical protein
MLVTVIISVAGLIGNSLGVYVFMQRRYRKHSSKIYLLVLCISDSLFLLTHFFEDTLRTFIDVTLNEKSNKIDAECIER